MGDVGSVGDFQDNAAKSVWSFFCDHQRWFWLVLRPRRTSTWPASTSGGLVAGTGIAVLKFVVNMAVAVAGAGIAGVTPRWSNVTAGNVAVNATVTCPS